jgi:hypothetical protein
MDSGDPIESIGGGRWKLGVLVLVADIVLAVIEGEG